MLLGELNTLPPELQGQTTTVRTPEIYALGTLTTGVSALVIGIAVASFAPYRRYRARRA